MFCIMCTHKQIERESERERTGLIISLQANEAALNLKGSGFRVWGYPVPIASLRPDLDIAAWMGRLRS